MLGLLSTFLLVVAGISLAYRFSPAAKLKTRIHNALSPFEDLDADIHSLQQTLRNEIESLARQYIDAIYLARLRAIPVDDLKKYATGMRLQALKDVGGVWSLASRVMIGSSQRDGQPTAPITRSVISPDLKSR
jgi:hypothetical protein